MHPINFKYEVDIETCLNRLVSPGPEPKELPMSTDAAIFVFFQIRSTVAGLTFWSAVMAGTTPVSRIFRNANHCGFHDCGFLVAANSFRTSASRAILNNPARPSVSYRFRHNIRSSPWSTDPARPVVGAFSGRTQNDVHPKRNSGRDTALQTERDQRFPIRIPAWKSGGGRQWHPTPIIPPIWLLV